ncbi:MAG TPA: hypothetical protein VKP30_14015 [Polyangiaceae bacterium]|nr:hypothetical protein [Polyangiaceae bacterium]
MSNAHHTSTRQHGTVALSSRQYKEALALPELPVRAHHLQRLLLWRFLTLMKPIERGTGTAIIYRRVLRLTKHLPAAFCEGAQITSLSRPRHTRCPPRDILRTWLSTSIP